MAAVEEGLEAAGLEAGVYFIINRWRADQGESRAGQYVGSSATTCSNARRMAAGARGEAKSQPRRLIFSGMSKQAFRTCTLSLHSHIGFPNSYIVILLLHFVFREFIKTQQN